MGHGEEGVNASSAGEAGDRSGAMSSFAPRHWWGAIDRHVRLVGRPFRGLIAFAIGFKLVELILLGPLTAAGLALLMRRWGRVSVGNFEIAAFLLSPAGLLALVAGLAISLGTFYLELAGFMRLLADDRMRSWQALGALGPKFPRMLELGLRQGVYCLLLAAPWLAAIGGLYAVFWHGRDLYGLMHLKPREYWIVVIGAGVCAALGGVIVLRQVFRWILALPILLFEPGTAARDALGRSTERTGEHLPLIGGVVVAFAAAQSLFTTVVTGGLVAASNFVLDHAGRSVSVALTATVGVLVFDGLALAALSILGVAGLAAVILGLYHKLSPEVAAAAAIAAGTSEEPAVPLGLRRRVAWFAAGLTALAALTSFSSYRLLMSLPLRDEIEITAHRGGYVDTPENSLAALRNAIALGADWVELDVQHTADGALVVFHDSDLARLGGSTRLVAATTLAQMREIDLGRGRDGKFAGERVPTFQEFVAAADKIGLNVELKPHDQADIGPLVDDVVRVLRSSGRSVPTRICSLSYEAAQRARAAWPGHEIGFIAGAALGNLSKLDVDYLMVNAPLATREFVRSAHARNHEVHTWTVRDPDMLVRLLDRGVDNVITDDPGRFRQRLREIQGLDPVERMLIRARNAIIDR